ncbi:MAG: relaxase/mobilization nuclease domain-containing protein [Caulobacter sp.]|nr:relaxase/mobilization nuclease domain-containing protein [Caulobacter sp.]
MADFHLVPGFEDVWRLPVRPRHVRPQSVLGRADMTPRARLERVARRAPEVMVKVTGRTRDGAHLRAHLEYISRNGGLMLEDQDGLELRGREEVRETAMDWSALAELDAGRRSNSPMSVSIILSMPRETDPISLRDAARDFARDSFGGRFDFVTALHTDTDHPHVHLSVRALGYGGERLNPRKADLTAWRQRFAEALRDRGVEAEATPRRARGVVRKPERMAVRRLGERHERGQGPVSRVRRAGYIEAAREAASSAPRPRPWEDVIVERQRQTRGLYLAQAAVLARSADPDDRALSVLVREFVSRMPQMEFRRTMLLRELGVAPERTPPPSGRARTR